MQMTKVLGLAAVGAMLALAVPAAINPASASPQTRVQTAGVSDATDFSARRYHRRYYRYGYRPHYRPYYRPYYYARPYTNTLIE